MGQHGEDQMLDIVRDHVVALVDYGPGLGGPI
jgi:hypothetical protein